MILNSKELHLKKTSPYLPICYRKESQIFLKKDWWENYHEVGQDNKVKLMWALIAKNQFKTKRKSILRRNFNLNKEGIILQILILSANRVLS
jgi:hypothetical protein